MDQPHRKQPTSKVTGRKSDLRLPTSVLPLLLTPLCRPSGPAHFAAAFLLAGLCSLGCGGSGPRTAAVSGTVTYKGQPVPNANVSFVPEASSGRAATGLTDANGRFKLGTFSTSDGAILGNYRIGIIARGPDRPPKPGETGSGMPGELMPGEPTIPTKYFAPDTSGLTHEVKRGSNHVQLDLKD
jgi:hypothetical protein